MLYKFAQGSNVVALSQAKTIVPVVTTTNKTVNIIRPNNIVYSKVPYTQQTNTVNNQHASTITTQTGTKVGKHFDSLLLHLDICSDLNDHFAIFLGSLANSNIECASYCIN